MHVQFETNSHETSGYQIKHDHLQQLSTAIEKVSKVNGSQIDNAI